MQREKRNKKKKRDNRTGPGATLHKNLQSGQRQIDKNIERASQLVVLQKPA